jgi:hypothetical protein
MTFERAIHAGTAGLTPCKCGSESLHLDYKHSKFGFWLDCPLWRVPFGIGVIARRIC